MPSGIKQVGESSEAQAALPEVPEPRQREGSPWTGLGAVVFKEMADQLSSIRIIILEVLGIGLAFITVSGAMETMKSTINQNPTLNQYAFLYLKLFTLAKSPWPAFVDLISILVPPIAIILIFDTINGEFNRRTMSRILAQPIYRDALLMGKFLGGLGTLTLVLTAIWLLILGLGLFGLGVQPNAEEVARIFLLLLATIFYGGIWLALGLVFSVVFRQPATAILAALALFLVLLLFWDILATQVATTLSPIQFGTADEAEAQFGLQQSISRLSPNTLYGEVMVVLLNPEVNTLDPLGLVYTSQVQGNVLGAPLPLDQSLVLVWPQATGLVAGTLLLFALAYVLFQRQEIRA